MWFDLIGNENNTINIKQIGWISWASQMLIPIHGFQRICNTNVRNQNVDDEKKYQHECKCLRAQTYTQTHICSYL